MYMILYIEYMSECMWVSAYDFVCVAGGEGAF